VGPPALSTSGFRLCHVCELGRGDMSEIRSTKHTDRLRGIHDTDYGANGIQLPPTALRSRLVGPAGYCDGKGGSGMRGGPKLRRFSSTRSMRWRPSEGWMHCSDSGSQGQCHTSVTTSMLSINATPCRMR
jgi:hypothetical protein